MNGFESVGLSWAVLRIIDIPVWEFQRPAPLRGFPHGSPLFQGDHRLWDGHPVSQDPEDEARVSLVPK